MQDFTENLESLGDIQGKYPPGTLVLRAQYVYMLQDQFRDLERDYRKISEMYVAEMEKAAKLESVDADMCERKLKIYHCNEWHNHYTEFYIKSEADKVIADLEESHKKEVGQLLIEIAELKKERDWLAKDRALAYNDLEKRAQLNIQKDSKICRLKKALYKACANWAKSERYTEATWHGDAHREKLWANVQAKCLKKADEAK